MALANGTVDEDEGISVVVGTTFSSVGVRMMLASDPTSTASRLDDIFPVHICGHGRTASLHHPLRGDLLSDHLCMWHQTVPQHMDFVYMPPIGVSSTYGHEVQIGVVGHHRGQHHRCPIEHAIGDERPNFIRDLCQLDDGCIGARS